MHDQAAADFLAFQEAVLGRYSLDREIGHGGMGVVYLAHEVALDRPVALKVMPAASASQPELRERFLREARTAARLSHPHIVPIHAVGETDDFVYFAMAFVQGRTLGERIRTRGPLRGREAVRVLQEVAWALAYAHAEGIVHRDVKPDNILLEEGTGRALVTDFGIAHVPADSGRTGAEEVLGTAEFMSPEQARGEEVGPASDLYSLGVVAYYTLTGRLPFEGSTVAAVLVKHLTQPAPPLASAAPDVPRSLADAIDRCLEKDPARRFVDGATLAEALSPGGALVQRELPIPLRVFVRSLRDLLGAAPMIAFLWAAVALIPVVAGEGLSEWPLAVWVVLASISLSPLFLLGGFARRLLSAGYTYEDGLLALEEDRDRRLEEIRFEYGKGRTWLDSILRGGAWGGFLAAVVSIVVGLGFRIDLSVPAVAGCWTWILSAFGAAFRNKRRRDLIGDAALELLRTTLAKLSFQLAGVGLGDRAIGSGAHRPTEMAISIAADRLFDDLPKELRRELKGLPETIARLEADAARMRAEVDQLGRVAAEVGDGSQRVGSEEHRALKADLERTRDEARQRMTAAISALEKIRLGLLRLHAGDGTVESLTVELGTAREVSSAIERLLQGQRDVARLLRPPGLRTDP